MKHILLVIVLSVVLLGCSDKKDSTTPSKSEKVAVADLSAGKTFIEQKCTGCHGLDGKSAAPAIPHLAGQRESYLLAALMAYKNGHRTHAALKDMAEHMSDADARNVAAYYAGLSPVASAPVKDAQLESPYEKGKTLSAACAKCHGADGNSKTPGIPSLAGQQPRYFVVALHEYLDRERKKSPMHTMLPGLGKLDMENLALYFASQTRVPHPTPSFGDPAAGEPLSAVCGGCHGSHGVSTDSATPSLAGQDPSYLVDAIKAYRTTRKRESMRLYITGLSDKDIQNIAAFYAIQKSKPAEKGETIVQDLTEKCERCHSVKIDNPAMTVPKINGQDRDYLIMALRAYRDDKRESTTMHKMSLPYSDSIIESIASYYANQPSK
ncbi:MAG: cytochrome c4 [Gammaproteobacteria bacterium]|nr:cytochrome c4 [Gammaproteobacteria bacterium]